MGAQRLWRVEVTGQFSFRQRRVDFTVANMVHQDHWTPFATFEARDQVVQALRHIRWNGPVA